MAHLGSAPLMATARGDEENRKLLWTFHEPPRHIHSPLIARYPPGFSNNAFYPIVHRVTIISD